jgi:GGDEF domain-containing protein
MVSHGTIDSVSAVITDQRNRIILTSPGLALPLFSDLSGHPLMTAAAAEGPGKAYSFSGAVNNDGGTARYVAVHQPLDNGWQVYATATQAKADMTVLVYMALGLIWALLALLLARRIAPLYGEVVTQPLQKLEESLEMFDAARTITIIPPAPSDAPQEIRQTYARVRESMQNSREAYRNMLKVVNEGNELRKKLRTAGESVSQKLRAINGSGDKLGANDQTVVADRSSDALDLALSQEAQSSGKAVNGQLDPVTELPGRDVFEGFFGEAWTLGVADSRPISVINLRIGTTDDQTLKFIGQKLKAIVGRTLDFVGCIAECNFSIILPDTDLKGALAVTDRLRDMLQEHKIEKSFGVASIVPNINGNAKSFLDITQRALEAAHQKGDGQIVFVSDRGKLTLHTRADMIEWNMGEEASA